MPPVQPNKSFYNGHLYRLFRQEFVAAYGNQLCSDAYSGFIINDEEMVRKLSFFFSFFQFFSFFHFFIFSFFIFSFFIYFSFFIFHFSNFLFQNLQILFPLILILFFKLNPKHSISYRSLSKPITILTHLVVHTQY
jgi:hypothetical protein